MSARDRSAEMTATTATFSDYSALTKPRLSMLSVASSVVGYAAARHGFSWGEFFHVFAGTALCAGGVASLNQWMEAETDAAMSRTHDRPIPSGKVATGSAFVLGWLLVIAGLVDLFVAVNGWSALFALATVIAYLGFYTPSKKHTRWSTEIGAISGALPPLVGWSAAEGGVSALGWALFGILFFWQIPHFMAIAWMYRGDYAAVHFPMLPVLDESGVKVARWSLLNTFLTVGVSLVPVYLGLTGWIYGVTAGLLGLWLLYLAAVFLRPEGRDKAARRLFLCTITYLPLVFVALVVDRLLFFPAT
jgi:protoheme IX farnesyltransferase